MRLAEIAQHLNGSVDGDLDLEITGMAAIATARPGELSFVSEAKFVPLLEQTQASAVILDRNTPTTLACIRTPDPRLAFAQAIELFYQPFRLAPGVHPTAVIADDVQLGSEVAIGAHVVIGSGVMVGDRTQIHANVTVYDGSVIGHDCLLMANCVIHERSQIGNHCLIHSGAVIGDDGFGHVPQANGSWYRMPQSGIVVLEEQVDVGSNTTIDRPAVGETRIGHGTKIDNLVQIGHGVKIGSDCVLAAQAAIAGGTELGNHVVLGGQVGVTGHVKIGNRVMAAGGTAITGNVPAGQVIAGFPHQPGSEWRRTVAIQRNLPDLHKTVRQLQQQVAQLQQQIQALHEIKPVE